MQLLLDELGMNQEFFDVLREEYIKPITSVLYPEYGGASLDSHKVFVVKYKLGEDEDLACHFDNAEVGINITFTCYVFSLLVIDMAMFIVACKFVIHP